jgi:putative phosphoesterase
MKLAIISDTHDNRRAVEMALEMLCERGIDRIIHCGDICSAETVSLFRGFRTDFVLGNCDYDRESLFQAIQAIGATLHEPFGHLELEGARLAFVHGDDMSLLRGIEHSGEFAFLFYGHTHAAREHRTGPTRVINPGALQRVNRKTFALLDSTTGDVESVVVS